ncbi:MAG TPA: ankyrin repeat domain-containing protein [Gallionellaceae bacterium]
MKLKFTNKELFVLIAVSVMSLLANLPEGYGSLFNRKFLLGTVVAVVVIAMFRYLQVLLLLVITILAIGANLPQELAEDLDVNPTIAMAVLGLLIALTLVNRVFRLLPTTHEEQLEVPDDEAKEEDLSALDTASARQRMLLSIARGDIATVRKLLDTAGANFFQSGTTPLHMATEKGYSNIVKLLIEHGANLLAQNKDGQTPLDLALTIKKHVKTTNILYDATIPLLTSMPDQPHGA